MDIFDWLNDWYKFNCNGDWEHQYGIKLETMDNPGWEINIDLWETILENKIFEEISINNSDSDWITCKVEDFIYKGYGDPSKLKGILEIFKNWTEEE